MFEQGDNYRITSHHKALIISKNQEEQDKYWSCNTPKYNYAEICMEKLCVRPNSKISSIIRIRNSVSSNKGQNAAPKQETVKKSAYPMQISTLENKKISFESKQILNQKRRKNQNCRLRNCEHCLKKRNQLSSSLNSASTQKAQRKNTSKKNNRQRVKIRFINSRTSCRIHPLKTGILSPWEKNGSESDMD